MRLLYLLAFVPGIAFAQPKPEVAFRIPEKDLIPEGISYDPTSGSFYLGSIQKKKIIRVTQQGKISDFATAENSGLLVVLGMKVHKGKLWVCNNSPQYDSSQFISAVSVFDLTSGKVERRYELNDGRKHLFNDLVLTADGTAFVTDSDGGTVYILRSTSDDPEAFLAAGTLRYPNGIALSPDEKKLIVSTGSGLGIVGIDIQSKEVVPIQHEKFLLIGVDGLYRHKNSLIAVQNVTYPESIMELHCSEDFNTVKNIQSKAMNLPEFDSPTTGVIAGEYFYFIANSQLLQTIGSKGQIKKPGDLKETLIMRFRLN
jgi:DNA-binding beta-propeller fold protein YncE